MKRELYNYSRICQQVNPSPLGGLWRRQQPVVRRIATRTGIPQSWIGFLIARGYIDPAEPGSIDQAAAAWQQHIRSLRGKRGSVVDLAVEFGMGTE